MHQTKIGHDSDTFSDVPFTPQTHSSSNKTSFSGLFPMSDFHFFRALQRKKRTSHTMNLLIFQKGREVGNFSQPRCFSDKSNGFGPWPPSADAENLAVIPITGRQNCVGRPATAWRRVCQEISPFRPLNSFDQTSYTDGLSVRPHGLIAATRLAAGLSSRPNYRPIARWGRFETYAYRPFCAQP
jgi:hypothetical protein